MADKSAVKDLLSKALKAVDSMDESAKQTTRETTSTSNNALTPKQTTSTGSFRTELERLFPNVYGIGNKKRPSSAPDPRIGSRNKKRNTVQKTKEKTVIRKFVCLSDKDQLEIPSAQEKRDLFVCGLGEKKVQLQLNGDYVDLRATLRKEFPKLSDAGGIELMFAEQGKKELLLIPNGPAGMTVDYISQFIGQGRIYIRPIQCSLDQTVVRTEPSLPEETCNSCLQFMSMDKLREHAKVCSRNSAVCRICLECIDGGGVSPECCCDVFHSICLDEWHKHSDDSGAKCPVCNKVFFSIKSKGNNDSTNLITESTEREFLIPDSDRQPTQNSTSIIIQQEDGHCSSPLSGQHTSKTNLLPSQPSTSDSLYSSLFNNKDVIEVDSDSEFASTDEEVKITNLVSESSLQDILSGLAKKVDECKISKFNICRSDVWDGAKRGLTRKSFSPSNKISVRFSDDFGRSEGAIDWGGPTREFFTLVISWIVNSQLFCGPECNKFLSCNAECLHNSEYLYAGQIVALSLVHGGVGIKCLSPILFDALVHGPDKSVVTIEDVYDPELKSSLEQFSKAESVKEAYEIMHSTHLDTVLELGGTLQLIKSIDDIQKVVQQTAHWYVLGRSWPALDQFKMGMSVLGVMEAVKSCPDAFMNVLCHFPEQLTAEMFMNLFSIVFSEEGSYKRATENLIISYWNDYLQDVDEGEAGVTFGDILFFSCCCRELPPIGLSLSLGFLHEPEENGSQSNLPKANTCAPM